MPDSKLQASISALSSAPWPPPLDLASLAQLVRAADPEGHLADGAPADEYEPEEEQIFAALRGRSIAEMLAPDLLAIVEPIWSRAFALSPEALAGRLPALLSLAKELERFFGPEAAPRTRAQILADGHPVAEDHA